jgi:hypothetical protein
MDGGSVEARTGQKKASVRRKDREEEEEEER